MRAIEEQLDAFSADFEGEDVLFPAVRDRLDELKHLLLTLHEQVQPYTGPFELPEPDEEIRAMVERVVELER
jgi:hypothetical protein